jgi:hypothetical protein
MSRRLEFGSIVLASIATAAAVLMYLAWTPGLFWHHVPPGWIWYVSKTSVVSGGAAALLATIALWKQRSVHQTVALTLGVSAVLFYVALWHGR